jgi:hypothetical protein
MGRNPEGHATPTSSEPLEGARRDRRERLIGARSLVSCSLTNDGPSTLSVKGMQRSGIGSRFISNLGANRGLCRHGNATANYGPLRSDPFPARLDQLDSH